MWKRFIAKIKFRAVLVLLIIHAGFAIGLAMIFQMAEHGAPKHVMYGTLTGLATIYLGLWLGAFFVLQPFMPWFRRVRMIMEWKFLLMEQWPLLIKALPEILESVTALVQAVRNAFQDGDPERPPRARKSRSASSNDE